MRAAIIAVVALSALVSACQNTGKEAKSVVIIETPRGSIKVQLLPDDAPASVENFLSYVDEGFYDGTIFHRIIDGFMIQGGGFTGDMVQKDTHAPIKNEARADVQNLRGTLAMARTSVVDSATSQFFINLADNDFLDHKNESARGFGYAVFGKIVEGMNVADVIAKVPTTVTGAFENIPVHPVVINSIKRVEAE